MKGLPDPERISVAFVEPEEPGNIGFLARAMKNFGMSRLILVGGCGLGEDAWTYAMHAKDVIKRSERVTWDQLLGMGFDFYVGTSCRQGHDTNLPRVAIDAADLGASLSGVNGDICLLLGREGNGLSLDELEACDLVVRIPASAEYPALNVTHAAAILFYEIFSQSVEPPPGKMREANAREKEKLFEVMDSMIDSSALPDHRKRASRLVFRRLVNRAFVSGRECHTLIGLMKSLGPDPCDGSPRRPS